MPLIQVRQSAVHGRGVFAARPIRKGRRIIEYTGRRVPWKSIPANVKDAHTFLFGINDGTDVIDPTLGGNNQNPSARIAIQQRVTRSLLFSFSTDVSQAGSEIVQGEYRINKRWSVSATRDQLGGVSVDGKYHTKF